MANITEIGLWILHKILRKTPDTNDIVRLIGTNSTSV